MGGIIPEQGGLQRCQLSLGSSFQFGTNLQAIDAIDAGKLDATIELVVSSR